MIWIFCFCRISIPFKETFLTNFVQKFRKNFQLSSNIPCGNEIVFFMTYFLISSNYIHMLVLKYFTLAVTRSILNGIYTPPLFFLKWCNWQYQQKYIFSMKVYRLTDYSEHMPLEFRKSVHWISSYLQKPGFRWPFLIFPSKPKVDF